MQNIHVFSFRKHFTDSLRHNWIAASPILWFGSLNWNKINEVFIWLRMKPPESVIANKGASWNFEVKCSLNQKFMKSPKYQRSRRENKFYSLWSFFILIYFNCSFFVVGHYFFMKCIYHFDRLFADKTISTLSTFNDAKVFFYVHSLRFSVSTFLCSPWSLNMSIHFVLVLLNICEHHINLLFYSFAFLFFTSLHFFIYFISIGTGISVSL